MPFWLAFPGVLLAGSLDDVAVVAHTDQLRRAVVVELSVVSAVGGADNVMDFDRCAGAAGVG